MLPQYVKNTKEQFPQLTKGLKRVAEHLIHDPIVFAMHPAKKIGTMIGVSETMIIRFCHSIGYSGFSALQEDVRRQLLDFNEYSAASFNDNEDSQLGNLENNIQKDIQLFEQSLSFIEPGKYQSVIDSIINSEKIVLAGYYQSFTFAYWFYYNLNCILGNAYLYRPEIDNLLLDHLPKKACVIVFSFYRYAIDTIKFAKEAKSKGIKVIAFTDSQVAPIADVADEIILIHFGNDTVLRKGPITLSIMNGLLHEIFQQSKTVSRIPNAYKYFIQDGE